MELTRRALIGTGLGAYASAGFTAFVSRPAGGSGFVTPLAFGAIADDPDAGRANVRAFNAMAAHALGTGREIVIPRGTWTIAADGRGESGWTVRPTAGQRCVIRGEGPASVIRRAGSDRATKFSTLIRLWVTTGGESFDLEGFAVDGNEGAFPFDPADPWAYQQCHSIELAGASENVAARSMHVRDLWLTGIVADGIKVGGQCQSFEALRIDARGRVRRHRSDIQFSRLPKLAIVTDCKLDAFEAEPSKMVPGARMQLTNVVARAAFDLAGPEDDRDGRLQVIAENCRCGLERSAGAPVTSTNFFRLAGSFTNCAFATSPEKRAIHANVIRGSTLRFDSSRFLVGPGFADPAAATPLFAHFESPGDGVVFARCRFEASAGVTDGAYVAAGGVSPTSLLRLENCATATALEYVVIVSQRARVQMSGGSLRARKALVILGARKAAGSQLRFEHRDSWSAPAEAIRGEVTPWPAAAKP